MTTHDLKDNRQIQILEAAAELFAKNGFDRTSVDEIARLAGLSKGAIYWYFPSKEKILIALAEQFEQRNQGEVIHMADEGQLGAKALFMSHRHLFEKKADDPLPDLLFQQFISMASKYPEVREALERNERNWVEVIANLLNGAVEHGQFRPFDTKLVAEAISALYRGVCTVKYDQQDEALRVIEYATKLFYDALQPNQTPENSAEGCK